MQGGGVGGVGGQHETPRTGCRPPRAPHELATPPGSGVSVGQLSGSWLPLNHPINAWSPFIPG